MLVGKTKNFYVNTYSRHSGVTGSSYLNSVHWPDGRNVRFLLDAGAAQGKDNNGFFNCFFPYNTGKSVLLLLHMVILIIKDYYQLLSVKASQVLFSHILQQQI